MPERQCVGCKRQDEWGCHAIRYSSGPEDPNAFKDLKGNWWGWFKPSRLPIQVDGEDSYACPRQDIRKRGAVWSRVLTYYGMYTKGHLPQAGAVMDQANVTMELFRILDDANRECDRQLDAQARAQEDRNSGMPTRGRG